MKTLPWLWSKRFPLQYTHALLKSELRKHFTVLKMRAINSSYRKSPVGSFLYRFVESAKARYFPNAPIQQNLKKFWNLEFFTHFEGGAHNKYVEVSIPRPSITIIETMGISINIIITFWINVIVIQYKLEKLFPQYSYTHFIRKLLFIYPKSDQMTNKFYYNFYFIYKLIFPCAIWHIPFSILINFIFYDYVLAKIWPYWVVWLYEAS